MSLRRRGYMVESSTARIKVDLGDYPYDIKSHVYELQFSSERRAIDRGESVTWTQKDARQDVARLIRETKKNMSKVASVVQAAINRAQSWMGSTVVVKPSYFSRATQFGSEMGIEPVTSADVKLYHGSGYSADFTYFDERNIDDVLDAGDQDFFRAKPELEADYFTLVQELRQPGSTSRSGGRPLLLYTARPSTDRRRYDGAKSIPSGIFLTTDFDRALGFGKDFASGKGRDVYKIRIDPRYTVKTLDTGRIKDYQAVSPERDVPIASIERIS